MAFFLLFGLLMSGFLDGENFTLEDDLFEVVALFAVLIIVILSSVSSWMYVFRPPELIRDFWKYFTFGSLVIAIILLQINL